MANDLQTKKDVALKIMASGKYGEHEYRMQKEIQRVLEDEEERPRLVLYTDVFMLSGDNGCQHWVLVLPMRGEAVYDLDVRTKPMSVRMDATRQLLKTLEGLHYAGFVHRDLNERNCMWGIRSVFHLDRSAKYKALGRPLKQNIPFVKNIWKQGEIVRPLTIPDDLSTETFYLGDFGLATKLGTGVYQEGRPPITYCSPDRLHKQEPGPACDMWSYMCIFAELYFGRVPYTTWANGGVVTTMVELFGPLPREWKGCYVDPERSLDSWYESSGHTNNSSEKANLNGDRDRIMNLAANITRLSPAIEDPVEKQHVLSVLTKGFSMDPKKRPSARQLLEDRSFNAIVDKYCC